MGGLVAMEQLAMRIWFVPLEASAPKFFGFSEFLAGLALMVLAWTIADIRYRFRIWTAPIPLYRSTFAIVAAVGSLTLLTDLWRAQEWLVPKVSFFTSASWQALLAGSFFLTFLIWVFFAFIKPATFGKWNARRYAETIFGVIVKGSPTEMAVVADELRRSAEAIVFNATDRTSSPPFLHNPMTKIKEPSKVERCANDILSLIADKRFCRTIIESSPGTVWAFFGEAGEQKKYGIQIQTFAKNIVNEALENKDSFLYHETAGNESGMIGNYKPICQSIFSNYEMVEMIGTVLDTDYRSRTKWDSDQWEAYCRIVLMTFGDYIDRGNSGRSNVLYSALKDIGNSLVDLYRLNGVENSNWNDDLLAQLRVIVEFIGEAAQILEKKGVPADLGRRSKGKKLHHSENIYDQIAKLIFEVIFAASAVTSPRDQCWWVQHNAVWGELFNFGHLDGQAGNVVKSRVYRLLYNDIVEMKRLPFPNFKGARILGFCLNVMGLKRNKDGCFKDSRALHKAILIWARKNFAWLYNENPRVGEACLVDGLTYDVTSHRIILTYPAVGLNRQEQYIYLDVDPPPAITEKVET
jgi:hypothetical protein